MTAKHLLAFALLTVGTSSSLFTQDTTVVAPQVPPAAQSDIAPAPKSSSKPSFDPEIAALESLAHRYVTAYNAKAIDDLVALYTIDAELVDEIDARVAIGNEGIRAFYEAAFTATPTRQISLEVLSVRQLAENVVVEEGLAHFSGEDREIEESVVSYSAILVKGQDNTWKIASSREIETMRFESDPLEEILPLVGDWTFQGDQVQMDLSLYLSNSGRFIMGSAVVTTAADGAMETEIRIGYDADRDVVRWWTFDERGGFADGIWQALESSWLIRSSGVTADGEPTSALQELKFASNDSMVWHSTHRFLDGLPLPDLDLRLVRRPPAPASLFSPSEHPLEP